MQLSRLVMQNYGVIISVLIHVLLLSIPLSATLTRFSGQGLGDMEITVIDGSAGPAGARKAAVSGTAKRRAGKKTEPAAPKAGEKAEKSVMQRKEIKTAAASRQPDRKSEAVVDETGHVETKEDAESRDVAEPEDFSGRPVHDMSSAQADADEQEPASAVSARDSLQGEVAGKPDVAEFGTADGPAFIKRMLPEYPWMARKAGKEGRVLLKLSIDETGRLIDVAVVEKAGYGFDREAVRAVRRSTFRPAVRNGVPVKSEALLYVKFEFEDRK